MAPTTVIGIDGGGSRTRVALAGVDGGLVRRVEVSGTNLTSLSRDTVVRRLAGAVAECLVDIDPASVRYAVAGYAGAPGQTASPSYAIDVTGVALASSGVRCPVEVFADPELAYASGATGADGLVLVAGTGAVAARIIGGRMASTVDGHGWLVGDQGSGFWIGAAGLRATLRALDRRDPYTRLVRRLATELGIEPSTGDNPQQLRGKLVHAVMHQAPPSLAALAPAVLATAAEGDEVAGGILDAAVAHLVAAVAALEPQHDEQLVLAGGVAGAESTLSVRLADDLITRFGVIPLPVPDGTTGAIRLALAALGHTTRASHDAC